MLSGAAESVGSTPLQRALDELSQQYPQMGEVCVVLVDGQTRQRAVAGCDPDAPLGVATRASCVAKLFTVALLINLLARAKVDVQEEVRVYLPVPEPQRRALAGITFAHLLNHSHGLDDSVLLRCPLRPDDRVDTDSLCRELLASPPLFDPGDLHSYGSAGAYLASAVLEHLYDRPFRTLLERELLDGLGLVLEESPDPTVAAVCPATGGRWLLTPRDLATMLASHLELAAGVHGVLQGHLGRMLACSQSLPGWNPTEQGVHLGWKGYGADWYGHDGRWSYSSLLGRINTRHRVAIAIGTTCFTGRDPVYLLLSRLFGARFPELTGINVPTLLSVPEARSMDRAPFKGVYRSRASTVTVFEEGEQLFLRPASHNTAAAGTPRTYRLRPARNEIFVTAPAELQVFPYVQFIRPSVRGCYEYLWSGQNLWRRMDGDRD
jgi:CubicO group peptidase (beta-lactamase class C family)